MIEKDNQVEKAGVPKVSKSLCMAISFLLQEKGKARANTKTKKETTAARSATEPFDCCLVAISCSEQSTHILSLCQGDEGFKDRSEDTKDPSKVLLQAC